MKDEECEPKGRTVYQGDRCPVSLLMRGAIPLIILTCHSQTRPASNITTRLLPRQHPPTLAQPHLPMPNPISSNATLHALTERLASHSRTLSPFSFATDRLAAYRQPAPPPQLPVLQLSPRHQDASQAQPLGSEISTNGDGLAKCPVGNAYSVSGEHSEKRCSKCEDEELNGFMQDMSLVMRREYDCWVEQCW